MPSVVRPLLLLTVLQMSPSVCASHLVPIVRTISFTGPSFSGVLGLALPDNSVIASYIPPITGNAPDGAAWASNLFSITKGSDSTDTEVAPSEKFLSLTLSRPGSNKVPSLLGIGMHPPAGTVTLPDSLGGSSAQLGFNKVNYNPPLDGGGTQGPLFWKVAVTGISVWVDSQEKQIQMTKTPDIVDDGSSLTAVLDSGVPLIITSSAIANGIYGALGIGPASDGNCESLRSLLTVCDLASRLSPLYNTTKHYVQYPNFCFLSIHHAFYIRIIYILCLTPNADDSHYDSLFRSSSRFIRSFTLGLVRLSHQS